MTTNAYSDLNLRPRLVSVSACLESVRKTTELNAQYMRPLGVETKADALPVLQLYGTLDQDALRFS